MQLISGSHGINSLDNSVLVGITVEKTTGVEHVIQVITLFVPHTYLREPCLICYHSGELHNTVVVERHLRKKQMDGNFNAIAVCQALLGLKKCHSKISQPYENVGINTPSHNLNTV